MKRLFVMLLLLAATARAEWRDLKPGLDSAAVARHVGRPLMQSMGHRGAFVTWTYDNGGYVMFRDGLVTCWQAPRTAGGSVAKK